MLKVIAAASLPALAVCGWLPNLSTPTAPVPSGMLATLSAQVNELLASLPPQARIPAIVVAVVLGAVALLFVVQAGGKGSGGGGLAFFNNMNRQNKRKSISKSIDINDYNSLHHNGDYVKDGDKAGVEERNTAYAKMVNAYYELATSFYEWGWGQSFHFAQKKFNEDFNESIRRHEYVLASHLEVKPGMRVLDVGCGVGGPYRNIARFTGCNITGVTINEYQVNRANEINASVGMEEQVHSEQGDFMNLERFPDGTFDAVYAIEATCHAPKRQGVYGEILRVLKPGGVFACYEWVLTDKYDSKNANHRTIKKQIEEGDGLPDMASPEDVVEAMTDVGFEMVHARDMALDTNPKGDSWYLPLVPSWKPWTQRFQFTPFGQVFTKVMLRVMEFLYLAPAGTCKVQHMLQQGAVGIAAGGITGTFTPMYLMVGRKTTEGAKPKVAKARSSASPAKSRPSSSPARRATTPKRH